MIDAIMGDLAAITGQKPVRMQGKEIGCELQAA